MVKTLSSQNQTLNNSGVPFDKYEKQRDAKDKCIIELNKLKSKTNKISEPRFTKSELINEIESLYNKSAIAEDVLTSIKNVLFSPLFTGKTKNYFLRKYNVLEKETKGYNSKLSYFKYDFNEKEIKIIREIILDDFKIRDNNVQGRKINIAQNKDRV